MADYKRFNTSNSNDYNINATHPNGTLVWNDNFGIRLHDGETPGGDPLLSLHNWNDPFGQAVGNDGSSTIVLTGDQSTNGNLNVGEKFYITGDPSETRHTVTSRNYDGGQDITFVSVTPDFNVLPQNGTILYYTISKSNINQVQAGDGINLVNEGSKLIVEKAYKGQDQYLLTALSLIDGITLTELESSVILVTKDPAYTTFTPAEQHNITLPFGTDLIAVGTKITVINSSECALNVSGWFGPGYTIAPFASLELVYILDITADAKQWWVTSYFFWD